MRKPLGSERRPGSITPWRERRALIRSARRPNGRAEPVPLPSEPPPQPTAMSETFAARRSDD
jgi:hypothetical protein